MKRNTKITLLFSVAFFVFSAHAADRNAVVVTSFDGLLCDKDLQEKTIAFVGISGKKEKEVVTDIAIDSSEEDEKIKGYERRRLSIYQSAFNEKRPSKKLVLNSCNGINKLIERYSVLALATELYFNGHNLGGFPGDLSCFVSLKKLDMSCCGLTTIPEEVRGLPCLTHLDLSKNGLTSFPTARGLGSVEVLDLSLNRITDFPSTLMHLTALRTLNMCLNIVQTLPIACKVPESLESLKAPNGCSLQMFGRIFGDIDTSEKEKPAKEMILNVKVPDTQQEIRIKSLMGQ